MWTDTRKIIDYTYKGGNRATFWCHEIKYLHSFYFFIKKLFTNKTSLSKTLYLRVKLRAHFFPIILIYISQTNIYINTIKKEKKKSHAIIIQQKNERYTILDPTLTQVIVRLKL